MRRTVTRAILLAALAGVLLAAAACGGDDDESAADTQTPAAETSGSGDDATTDETETASSDDDDSDTSGLAGSEECRELVTLGSKVTEALGGSGDANLEETQEFLDGFADDAPEEIRDDFEVIAEAYGKIAEALEGVDLTSTTPDPEALAKLQELSSEIDQAELQEANTNITAWVTENCGTVTTD